MKKTLLLFFVATIAIVACKTKTPIKVGLMECYNMDDGETEAHVDKKLLRLYDDELRIAQTNSYINKLTTGKTNTKYFGFVLADLTEKIIYKLKADSSITVIEEKSIDANETSYHFYKVKKRSGLLLVKILFKQPSLTNSIMVDAVFDTEKHWTDFYTNAEAFTKKFECKDEDKKP